MITEIKNQVVKLSVQIAEKLLTEELSKDRKQEVYIEKLLKEVKFN